MKPNEKSGKTPKDPRRFAALSRRFTIAA